MFNVIDVRQSYLQKIVRAGLQALGHPAEAERSTHFAYEMVALSPATARQLGFLDEAEGEEKVLEMSGRKGIGVKADDLIDQLEVKAREEIAAIPEEAWSEDLWDLILEVAQTGETVEKAAESLELSLVARHALEIAQRFNALYHRHPILQEKDPQIRAARLATVQIFRRGLESLGELLGIPVPEKM